MKTIVFLGSSVTYGAASQGVSFADILCERNGYLMIKEAVSGTTLTDEGPDSYISRLKTIDAETADLFICQLSTNDATCRKLPGNVSRDSDMEAFDVKTIAGAIEYIIAYARKKWACPVLFYTNPRYDSPEYAAMVELLKQIADKWKIGILNLWDEEEFNAISPDARAVYMADPIHPTLEGYREWWVPEFEKAVHSMI
ncbi:MAG: SGNH/GDSL hydrolase family protein [Lachnospiraceae bacterium]|nr:SGNH/GDSL hydrolase family protein [Lachnospiraceae bacterium]